MFDSPPSSRKSLVGISVIMAFLAVAVALLGASTSFAQNSCPGYTASNVQQTDNGLTADLSLAGPACNIYGTDLPNLTLTVEYQTSSRLHVIIEDQNQTVYQVPEDVVPRPNATDGASASSSQLLFNYTESPFSFSVSRSNGEVLFDTSAAPLIFESQYLGLRTSLPNEPNLYGLGEHSDSFRLNTSDYTRTLWSRDAYGIPSGTNLYGNHPIYLDNRGENGTHAVLFMNSNGMDIKINDTEGQYLEYNTLGGVLDFYFMAGPTPIEAVQQISEVVGKATMMSYWTFGYHQCRYGYRDVYNVAEVVYNFSQANIPLETMWTDIDYMDYRKVFTLNPTHFPLEKMRELIDYLHQHQQHYIVMVDPAVAAQDYDAYNTGVNSNVFLKHPNGSLFVGVVWPGPTVFPDWDHPNASDYWNNEFVTFFSAEEGVDIDGLWIDMNEAANFCNYPCADPEGYAAENNFPPEPPPARNGSSIPLPGFPADFQPPGAMSKRQDSAGMMMGLPDRELIDPPYMIQNAAGSLSNKTINTNLIHYNGLTEYDTHNMYGSMMSTQSREAMLQRRPDVRPLVITRSTFLGAGTQVGHWTGDNVASWQQYIGSINSMLNFNSIFQIPMVGSDVCGFAGNTTETLCARWMMLGAFNPFYRNHNGDTSISQEPYLWESVAAAARYAMDIRYRMLDYFYTAFYIQTQSGKPSLNPLWYLYPNDTNTFGNDYQFFFGDALLVSPVREENSTSVEIYLPDDLFYDWNNGFARVLGEGANVTLDNIDFQTIPLHVRGGVIIPLRNESANTTTEVRKKPFSIFVAPDLNGDAAGSLYLDEGDLLDQPSTSFINFTYSYGSFAMSGTYDYDPGVNIQSVVIGGMGLPAGISTSNGDQLSYTYNSTTRVVTVNTNLTLNADASFRITQQGESPNAAPGMNPAIYAVVTLSALLMVVLAL